MSTKLLAWINLAWHFNKHVFTRLWLRPFRGGRDLAKFRKQVEPEGYVHMPAQMRAEFPRYMGCMHCGLCAIAGMRAQNKPASAWDEPWTFVGGASRSLDHVGLIVADMRAAADDAAAETVCPMGVPITHLASAVRSMSTGYKDH